MIVRLRRAAAPRYGAAASARPSEPPFSKSGGDEGRPDAPRRTPPHDQGQRQRADKTTVRPPANGQGIEHDE